MRRGPYVEKTPQYTANAHPDEHQAILWNCKTTLPDEDQGKRFEDCNINLLKIVMPPQQNTHGHRGRRRQPTRI